MLLLGATRYCNRSDCAGLADPMYLHQTRQSLSVSNAEFAGITRHRSKRIPRKFCLPEGDLVLRGSTASWVGNDNTGCNTQQKAVRRSGVFSCRGEPRFGKGFEPRIASKRLRPGSRASLAKSDPTRLGLFYQPEELLVAFRRNGHSVFSVLQDGCGVERAPGTLHTGRRLH